MKSLSPFILVLLLALFPEPGKAQQADTAGSKTGIEAYLQQAAMNNPELKAQYRQYLASLKQVPQVNTLPDPELSFGYFINPIETRVGPQQARFGITQMFPWFGTLGNRGEAAAQMAKAKFEVFQEARNSLFYRVQQSWYRIYSIEQSIRILQENIDILETFEALATRRYETGQVGQVDVLRVQIEKEDLNIRLELMKDNRKVALQQFNELLNRKAGTELSLPDTLSAKSLAFSGQQLEQAVLQQNPMITRLDYEAASARESVEAARKDGLPKFGLGLDYVVTGERNMAMPDNGQDAIMARAGIQIPLYRKKYRAKEQQARIELQSVYDRQDATRNRLLSRLEEALRDYHDAGRRVAIYKEVQIQRSRQAIDIMSEEYATSSADFEELLRLQRKLLDYELSREQALAEQHTAAAYIDYLYGKYNIQPDDIN